MQQLRAVCLVFWFGAKGEKKIAPAIQWERSIFEAVQWIPPNKYSGLERILTVSLRALREHPWDAKLVNLIGVVLTEISRYEDAVKEALLLRAAAWAFDRSIALRSVWGPPKEQVLHFESVAENRAALAWRTEVARLNRLGGDHLFEGRWDEASSVFQEALDIAPAQEARLVSNLGMAKALGALRRSYYASGEESTSRQQLLESHMLIEKALQDEPYAVGDTAKGVLDMVRNQLHKKTRANADSRKVYIPEMALRRIAVDNTLICTWSGGEAKEFALMALNLYLSVCRHAPRWERAFAVMALDTKTETFLRENGVTTWLHETKDTFMIRWKLMLGVLEIGLDVLEVDTDVVFLGDPFPHFYMDADFECMTDHLFPGRDLWNASFRDEEHINTGFVLARSTQPSKVLLAGFIAAYNKTFFDLFDQRLFSRFVFECIESGCCESLFNAQRIGGNVSQVCGTRSWQQKVVVRVLDPRVIAHGASFFWLRSHRLLGLEQPPVLHANFGRDKLYFLRDRRVWLVENFENRFKALQKVRSAPFLCPAHLGLLCSDFSTSEDVDLKKSSEPTRFIRYWPKKGSWTDGRASGWNGVSLHFLAFCAALEVAVALGRLLILPDAFDCRALPFYEAYEMNLTFKPDEAERCPFDYFADSETFMRQFGNLVVESGFTNTSYFQRLSAAPAHLVQQLARSFKTRTVRDRLRPRFADLRNFRERSEVLKSDVVDVGFDDGDDIFEVRDALREQFGTDVLGPKLWRCKWVKFEHWVYAHHAGQKPPWGRSACGVEGLDCCGTKHGWADKSEYFVGVPWDVPCDCGIGAAMGCVVREAGECLHQDSPPTRSDRELEEVRRLVGGMERAGDYYYPRYATSSLFED